MQPIPSTPLEPSSVLPREAIPDSSMQSAKPKKPTATTPSQASPSPSATSPQSAMTWKERGDFHLQRQEVDLAIESFTKALLEAEKQKNLKSIATALKDLGRAYLDKEQWTIAAKILNGAYALSQHEGKTRQTLLSLMAEVERRFLEKECGISKKKLTSKKFRKHFHTKRYMKRRKALQALRKSELYIERREELQTLRDQVVQGIKDNLPSEHILKQFSEDISLFLEKILESNYAILGKPPTAFALIGLGSLARNEMSPFSDLEFALLIK